MAQQTRKQIAAGRDRGLKRSTQREAARTLGFRPGRVPRGFRKKVIDLAKRIKKQWLRQGH